VVEYVALVVVIAGFVLGVYAGRRFVPPLAASIQGRIASWIVAALAGAAAGVTVDALWVAARTLTQVSGQPAGPIGLAEQVITSTAQQILLQAGALIALAAIVYLLGPTDDIRLDH
jgi:hypothetical protein